MFLKTEDDCFFLFASMSKNGAIPFEHDIRRYVLSMLKTN